MLGAGLDEVRLFVHVLAAAIWVGGQLVLAGLVAVLRGVSPEAPGIVARDDYRRTLVLKLVVVALSGAAALGHARAS